MTYTPKQLRVLQIIYAYQKGHGFSPTYAELAKKLNVTSSTVCDHLKTLANKKAIRFRHKEARSVEILDYNFSRNEDDQINIDQISADQANIDQSVYQINADQINTDQISKAHVEYAIKWIFAIMDKLGTEKLTWDGEEVTIFFEQRPWSIREFKEGTWSRIAMKTLQSKIVGLPPFTIEPNKEDK